MTTTRIHFVRHGESESNASNLIFQPIDEPLTEAGLVQAEAAAERFAQGGFSPTIHSSDMTRALLTARIIGLRAGIDVVPTDLLREIRRPSDLFGKRKGDPDAAIIQAETERAFIAGKRYLDEETFEELFERSKYALEAVLREEASDVIAVTHGGFLRFLLSYMIHQERLTPEVFLAALRFYRTRNTGITVVERTDDGEWHLLAWNDHSHLG